jgi:hypothetical protein
VARSHSVYVVSRPDSWEPVAAFTVKHELDSWLAREQEHFPRCEQIVHRMRDGGWGPTVRLDPHTLDEMD